MSHAPAPSRGSCRRRAVSQKHLSARLGGLGAPPPAPLLPRCCARLLSLTAGWRGGRPAAPPPAPAAQLRCQGCGRWRRPLLCWGAAAAGERIRGPALCCCPGRARFVAAAQAAAAARQRWWRQSRRDGPSWRTRGLRGALLPKDLAVWLDRAAGSAGGKERAGLFTHVSRRAWERSKDASHCPRQIQIENERSRRSCRTFRPKDEWPCVRPIAPVHTPSKLSNLAHVAHDCHASPSRRLGRALPDRAEPPLVSCCAAAFPCSEHRSACVEKRVPQGVRRLRRCWGERRGRRRGRRRLAPRSPAPAGCCGAERPLLLPLWGGRRRSRRSV